MFNPPFAKISYTLRPKKQRATHKARKPLFPQLETKKTHFSHFSNFFIDEGKSHSAENSEGSASSQNVSFLVKIEGVLR